MSAVISNATIDVKSEELPEVVALSIISLYTTAEMSPEQETLLVEWVNKHISAHMSGRKHIRIKFPKLVCSGDLVELILGIREIPYRNQLPGGNINELTRTPNGCLDIAGEKPRSFYIDNKFACTLFVSGYRQTGNNRSPMEALLVSELFPSENSYLLPVYYKQTTTELGFVNYIYVSVSMTGEEFKQKLGTSGLDKLFIDFWGLNEDNDAVVVVTPYTGNSLVLYSSVYQQKSVLSGLAQDYEVNYVAPPQYLTGSEHAVAYYEIIKRGGGSFSYDAFVTLPAKPDNGRVDGMFTDCNVLLRYSNVGVMYSKLKHPISEKVSESILKCSFYGFAPSKIGSEYHQWLKAMASEFNFSATDSLVVELNSITLAGEKIDLTLVIESVERGGLESYKPANCVKLTPMENIAGIRLGCYDVIAYLRVDKLSTRAIVTQHGAEEAKRLLGFEALNKFTVELNANVNYLYLNVKDFRWANKVRKAISLHSLYSKERIANLYYRTRETLWGADTALVIVVTNGQTHHVYHCDDTDVGDVASVLSTKFNMLSCEPAKSIFRDKKGVSLMNRQFVSTGKMPVEPKIKENVKEQPNSEIVTKVNNPTPSTMNHPFPFVDTDPERARWFNHLVKTFTENEGDPSSYGASILQLMRMVEGEDRMRRTLSGDNYIVYFVDESLYAADSVSHFLHVTTVDRKDDYHDIVKMGHKRVVSMAGSELTWTSRFDKFFTNFVFTVYERYREGEHATKLIP